MTNDEQDLILGEALRGALDAEHDERFVDAVLTRAESDGLVNAGGSFDVLSMWAGPGLVAAAVVILALGAVSMTSRPSDSPQITMAEGIQAGATVEEMSEPAPPEPESMMAIAFSTD